jgi:hypothetical protein
LLAQISVRHTAYAIAAAAVSIAACVLVIWLRFSAEGRTRFKRLAETEWLWSITFVAVAVAWATAGFVLISATLYEAGYGTIAGPKLHGTHLIDTAYTYYLWHLAHAIPALDITETANWKLRHPFTDSLQGALVLIYTIIIVAPVVYLAAIVLRRLLGSDTVGDKSNAAD